MRIIQDCDVATISVGAYYVNYTGTYQYRLELLLGIYLEGST